MSFLNTLADAFTVVLAPADTGAPAAETEAAAAVIAERKAAADAGPIEIRSIPLSAIKNALIAGFDDLRHCRTDMLTMAAVYPAAGLLIAAVVADNALVPFLFPAAAGFALIGPLATLWFAALSRQREYAGVAMAEEAGRVFGSSRLRTLQVLAGVAILLFLLWNGAAALIYFLTLGSSSAAADAFFLVRVFTTMPGWAMIFIGCAVGGVFAVIAVAIGCISFPLALDRPITAREAMAASFQAVERNAIFMMCWGIVIVAGLILGTIPGLLGLAFTLPILGHATWHIYRRIVG